MSELVRVFKTFVSYLVRPSLYPELFRKIYKNIFDRQNAVKGKDVATNWAKERSLTTEAFLTKEIGNYETFTNKYKSVYDKALMEQNNCPIKMGGAGDLDLLYYLTEKTQAQNIIETGVAYGWSSLALLQSLKDRNGTLYSSDMPYLDRNGDKYVGCVVPDDLKSNWKLFRSADKESLPAIFKEQSTFEIIHYDSDKSYKGRMWAYEELFNKVTKNGYFISDDIQDNSAFMDFCKMNNIEPIVIFFEEKYIGVIKK